VNGLQSSDYRIEIFGEKGILCSKRQKPISKIVGIGRDLENYEWQEWDNTQYIEEIAGFFDKVHFFIPSLFLQIGHDNFRFQATWIDSEWGAIVHKMKVRHFETRTPEQIQELEIPADSPVDNLVNTL
jgi:hypothetical protein